MKTTNSVVGLFLLSCLLVTGCGNSQRAKLVGIWQIETAESLLKRLDGPNNPGDSGSVDEISPAGPTMQLQFFRNGGLTTTTQMGIVSPTPKEGRWEMESFDDGSQTMKIRCLIGLQETEHDVEFVNADTIKMVPPNLAGLSLKLTFQRKK